MQFLTNVPLRYVRGTDLNIVFHVLGNDGHGDSEQRWFAFYPDESFKEHEHSNEESLVLIFT